MNAFKIEKSVNMMLTKKVEELRKEYDFEIGNVREMFNYVVSRLNSTDRALRSEIDTIKNETKENVSAAKNLVHDIYVVCQQEINDTRDYFNDVMLRKKFDEMKKERDNEIGNVREMFNNVVSKLNSTARTFSSEIDTIKHETKANMSAAQKLVHDSYVVCQENINQTRAYFKDALTRVNESMKDRSMNALHEISRIKSDIAKLKTSNEILKTVTDSLIKRPHSCDFVEKSGEYIIYPSSNSNGIRVYCYKDSTNRGWIVIQRRADGSMDFNRTWADYKAGFGDLSGEFWLGNEHIYQLTKDEQRELRIDMETFDGKKGYALY
ncbi:fibroleukin-like [Dreissena polymorpha]|uniref:Fibrinogen C-terminal domain-containing protein n=1 Tax=Dreissena polymorpha TaxID=45954 RepID=A0A9D4IXM8_DREPO|nr:fibroleukin-like [Dreissena polymorpha]KAH3792081.1 hypothetical protein DPMN_145570 [Dreissena polymorpha]